MLTLRSALLLNGISSGITGVALVVLSGKAALLFGTGTPNMFISTGVFLLLFAAFVVATARSKFVKPGALKMINALDLMWILASIIVLIADGPIISTIGNILIAAVAAWVGLMIILQRRSEEKQLVSL